MRRLVLAISACALAVPAAVVAAGDGSSDGTLSVKNATGKILLKPFNGSAVGRIASGKIVVADPVFDDGAGPVFWGCDKTDGNEVTTFCSGKDIRFRAIGGSYTIFINGTGISLSVVGRGNVRLDGNGADAEDNDGVFSVNDGPYRSLPNVAKPFLLTVSTGD
jgi:hypothetical protein